MRIWLLLAAAPAPAIAQPPAEPNLIAYPAAFFAASQPVTALDMVQRLPGFAFDPGDAQVRGYAGALGNVLIDGAAPASKSDPLQEVLSRIPSSRVERIELVRGGAPGIDMHGRAVVANLVLRRSISRQASVTATGALYADGRTSDGVLVEASSGEDRRSVSGSLELARKVDQAFSDGVRVQVDGTGQAILGSQVEAKAGGDRLTLKAGGQTPALGGEIKANLLFVRDRYGLDLAYANDAPPLLETNADRQATDEGEIGLRYERPVGARATLEALVLARPKTQSYRSRAVGLSDQFFVQAARSLEAIGRVGARFDASPRRSFEWGGEFAYNRLASDTRFTQDGVEIAIPSGDVTVEERRAEAFASATLKPTPKLTVEAGARLETSTIAQTGDGRLNASFLYPKPRLQLTWSPGADDQLRLRIEREVGQLDFGDFTARGQLAIGTVDAGNPELHPDRRWVVETAYEHRFWGDGAAVLTLRREAITDVVDRIPVFDPSGLFDAPGNIGPGTSDEVRVDLTLPLDRLGMKRGLLKTFHGWRWSQVADPTTGERRRISGQNPYYGEVHLTQDLPARGLKWGVDYYTVFDQFFYRFNIVQHVRFGDWYAVFAERKLARGLNLRLELQNITRWRVKRDLDVYGGPRGSIPLEFTERRDLVLPAYVLLRIRKELV